MSSPTEHPASAIEAMIAAIGHGQLPPMAQREQALETLVEHLLALPIDDALYLAASAPDWQTTAEGLDYHMEGGLLVFTAWYHLRRGYCCGNGCRHCPYPPSHKA